MTTLNIMKISGFCQIWNHNNIDHENHFNEHYSQWTHNIKMTSYQRRCDVKHQNDVVSTSMRRDHVASTLIRRHFDVSYQRRCDVITFRINVDATWSRRIDVDTTSFWFWCFVSTSMRRIWFWCFVSTSMRRDHVASTLIRRHFDVVCLLGLPSLLTDLHFSYTLGTLIVRELRTKFCMASWQPQKNFKTTTVVESSVCHRFIFISCSTTSL